MSDVQQIRPGWILGRLGDALIFTGPILLALALIAYADARGVLYAGMPLWMFALLIVACDVGHVYATAFRVYLDPARFRKRPGLFVGVPLACFALGVVAYGFGGDFFWRALAYLAAWHFVRQQWGWVAFTRAKAGEGTVDRRLDQAVIYAVTLYPLLFWHAHLPRAFHWFREGDFVALPAWIALAGAVVHWSIVGAFALRQLQHAASGRGFNLAKIQVVFTTWIAWYGGIVVLDSDIAFTALNVLSHAIPYLVVVWTVERRHGERERTPLARWFAPRFVAPLLGVLVLVGYAEEWLWDSLVWQDHAGLFPGAEAVGLGPLPAAALGILVPLLAVPQATHYVLDGWLWRRKEHTDLTPLFQR
ncbi:MAG: hypothetical protein AAGB93_06000 [Planctomycetota bacterium]